MNYIKKYIQQLLIRYCDSWLESYEESSINIGVFEGHINFSNLILKTTRYNLNENFELTIQYGRIDNIKINFPWSNLRTGELIATVDSIDIVISINQKCRDNDINIQSRHEKSENNDGLSQKNDSNRSSFLWKYLEYFTSNLLTKLFQGFSLHLNNLNLIILVPTEGHQCNCVSLNLSSFNILKSNEKGNDKRGDLPDKCFKSILLNNITIKLFPIQLIDISYDYSRIKSYSSSYSTVLSPMSIHTIIAVESVISLFERLQGLSNTNNKISIDVKVDNIEFTPNIDQIELLLESIYKLSHLEVRDKSNSASSLSQKYEYFLEINFSISRFAVLIYKFINFRAFTLIIYNVSCTIIDFPLNQCSLTIDRIRAFGVDNIEMIRIGENHNVLDEFSFSTTGQAVNFEWKILSNTYDNDQSDKTVISYLVDVSSKIGSVFIQIDYMTVSMLSAIYHRFVDDVFLMKEKYKYMSSHDATLNFSTVDKNFNNYHVDFLIQEVAIILTVPDDNSSMNYILMININSIFLIDGNSKLEKYNNNEILENTHSEKYVEWYDEPANSSISVKSIIENEINIVHSHGYNCLLLQSHGFVITMFSDERKVSLSREFFNNSDKIISQNHITNEPCYLAVVLSFNFRNLSNNEIIECAKRIDFFASHLDIALTSSKIIQLLNIFHKLSMAFSVSSRDHDSNTSSYETDAFRNKNLSSLCQLSCHIYLDSITINLCEEATSNTTMESLLRSSVREYVEVTSNYGFNSTFYKLFRLAVCKQFIKIGIPIEKIELLIDDINTALRKADNLSIDSLISNYLKYTTTNSMMISYKTICKILLYNFRINLIELTYDKKIFMFINEIFILDGSYISIVDVLANKIKVNNKANNNNAATVTKNRRLTILDIPNDSSKTLSTKKKKSLKKPVNYFISVSSFPWCIKPNFGNYDDHPFKAGNPAVVLIYTENDSKWEWGKGGYGVSDPIKSAIKSVNILLKCQYLNCNYYADRFIALIENVIEEINLIRIKWLDMSLVQKSDVNKTLSKPKSSNLFLRNHRRNSIVDKIKSLESNNKIRKSPVFDYSMETSFHSVNLLINYSFDVPLLILSIKKLKFEFDFTWSLFYHFQYLKFSLLHLRLLDLTKLANLLYHQIIWSKETPPSSKNKASPIMLGEYSGDESQENIMKLHVIVSGIRVCYLNRFLLEVINFINEKMVNPMNATLQTSSIKFENDCKAVNEFRDNTSFVDAMSSIDSINIDDDNSDLFDKVSQRSSSSGSNTTSDDDSDHYIRTVIKNENSKIAYGSTKYNNFFEKDNSNLKKGSNALENDNSKLDDVDFSKLDKNIKVFYWFVSLKDSVVITPRNSITTDLFSLKVKSIDIFNMYPDQLWPTLNEKIVVPEKTNPLYFELVENNWIFSSTSADDINCNEVFINENEEEYFDVSDVSDIGVTDGVLPAKSKRFCTFKTNYFKLITNYDIRRFIIELNGIEALLSRGDSVSTEKNIDDPILNLNDIKNEQAVFSSNGHSNSKNSSCLKQLWRTVSLKEFNCLLVFDFNDLITKLLIGDTKTFSALKLSLSMAEFYLLLSCVWFDNFFEPMQEVGSQRHNENSNAIFTVELWPAYGSSEYWSKLRNRISSFELSIVRAETYLDCYIDYNYFDKDPYCMKFFDDNSLLHKDCGGFEKFSLSTISVSGFVYHEKLDDETIQISISAGDIEIIDLRQPSKTVNQSVVRIPSKDLANNIDKSRRYGKIDFDLGLKDSPSDFSNEVKISTIISDSNPPISYTFLSSRGSNWGTSNLWFSYADINIKNLEFIYGMVDYFSNYFRFEEYGHPGVAAYNAINGKNIPYGGIDTRVFAFFPHIQILEDPLNITSQFMTIETDKTVYFRYLFDKHQSIKTDLFLYDVSVVLLKSYLSSKNARGLRGSAGSGRGIRTVIEYLCLGLHCHFDKLYNKRDIGLKISNSLTNLNRSNYEIAYADVLKSFESGINRKSSKEYEAKHHNFDNVKFDYVDINKEILDLQSATIAVPHAIVTSNSINLPFTVDSIDFVTSFEDLLYVIKLFTDFLAVDENDDAVEIVADNIENSTDVAHKSMISTTNTYILIKVSGLRIILVDNVLGLHLPLFQAFLEDMTASIDSSHISEDLTGLSKSKMHRVSDIYPQKSKFRSSKLVNTTHEFIFGSSKHFKSLNQTNDGQLFTLGYSTIIIWAEYFNNMKKCWEPLMERFECIAMYEKGPSRGLGLTVRSKSSIHVNVSSALVRALGDTLNMVNSTSSYMNSSLSTATVTDYENKVLQPNLLRDSTYKVNWSPVDTPILNEENELFYVDRQDLFDKNDDTTLSKRPKALTKKSRRGSRASFIGNVNKIIKSSNSESVIHCESQPLQDHIRVGFSIQNKTGQSVRYLQQWADGKWRVQYINNGERGLLNFIASTTLIRNNQLVEEAFNAQMEYGQNQNRSRNKKRRVGHEVAVQVAGSKWIREVQADVLSVKYHDLHPVTGRMNPYQSSVDWKIVNALKLMAEVSPHYGGRMLKLTSVFSVKNNTTHEIDLVALEATANDRLSVSKISPSQSGDYDQRRNIHSVFPFKLKVGEIFDVPLALLHRSSIASNMKSLGNLFIRPSDISSAESELGIRSQESLDSVDYSLVPISLMNIVKRTSELLSSLHVESGISVYAKDLVDNIMIELYCMMSTTLKHRTQKNLNKTLSDSSKNFVSTTQNSGKLPPFSYAIEVQRVGTLIEGRKEINRVQRLQARFFQSKDQSEKKHDPIHYVIIIHPPIILENLLPIGGIFEIVHATQQQRVLWSSWIDPGKAVSIHTVSLDEPLLLLISIRYARTSEGVIIHEPAKRVGISLVGKIQMTLEGLLDEGDNDDTASVVLTDTVGQRITINIDNIEGQAGQRHIVIYCPYWIVNTSQYTIRIREEGTQNLPAGSVTPQKDGSRQVIILKPFSSNQQQRRNVTTIYPGTKGPFHSSISKEFLFNSDLHDLLTNISFNNIVDYAYIFNYGRDDGRFIGKRKVCFQMDESDWSRPFSLDAVGVNQVVTVDNHDFGIFEVGFKITVAPGRLGKYTKIVRFVPKFVVVNKLNCSIRLFQPVGFSEPSKEIEVSGLGSIRPFHLPELFGERKLRLLVDGPWHKSVPFDIDQIGGYTLLIKRKTTLASLHHVNTRGAPEYTVHFPGGLSEIGVWFETDWGEQNTVVKSIQSNSFASKQTDIHVGDVLLAIDGEDVRSNFDLNMLRLKNKLKEPNGCTVKFRTVEEKIKKIRDKAIRTQQKEKHSTTGEIIPDLKKSEVSIVGNIPSNLALALGNKKQSTRQTSSDMSTEHSSNLIVNNTSTNNYSDDIAVRIDIKTIEAFTAIIFSPVNDTSASEYRLDNMSVSHLIYYKQKGVMGLWSCIAPGHSTSFIWEDPFKPHKLLILAGRNVLLPESEIDIEDITKISGSDLISNTTLSCITGVAVDLSITEIYFDDIGQMKQLPLPRSDAKLLLEVKSQGPAKTLVISPEPNQLKYELKYSTNFLNFQILELNELSKGLRPLLSETKSYGLVENILTSNLKLILQRFREKQDSLISEYKSHLSRYSIESSKSSSVPIFDNNSYKLTSFTPIESVLGLHISKQHQLLIDVLEAKDLMPFVAGKMEDVYCKVYLRFPSNVSHDYQQRKYTYVCYQTLDPGWVGQKFIFNIPSRAAIEARGFSLRVVVKSKTVIQLNRFLGQTDIHFAGLRDESEVEGWFPLQPETSSFKASVTTGVITGSVKLKLQWIHSNIGLTKYSLNTIDRRLKELNTYYELQFNQLHFLREQRSSIKSNHRGLSTSLLSNPLALTTDGLMIVGNGANALLSNVNNIAVSTIKKTTEIMKNFYSTNQNSSQDFELDNLNDCNEISILNNSSDPNKAILSLEDAPNSYIDTLNSSLNNNDKFDKSKDYRRLSLRLSSLSNTFDLTPPNNSFKPEVALEKNSIRTPLTSSVSRRRRTITGYDYTDLLTSGTNSEIFNRDSNTSKKVQTMSNNRRSLHYKNIKFWAEKMNEFQNKTVDMSVLASFQQHDGKQRFKSPKEVTYDDPVTLTELPVYVSDVMTRNKNIEKDNILFHARCLEECSRSYAHVNLTTGILKITPMHALNIPDFKKSVSVKVGYGDIVESTFSIPPAADLAWYQENKSDMYYHETSEVINSSDQNSSNNFTNFNASTIQTSKDFQKSLNESLTKLFVIDTLNIRGSIRIRVSVDDFPGHKNIAQLDLSVLDLLDCLCLNNSEDVYDRWFPLLLSSDCLPSEGEMGTMNQKLSVFTESTRYDQFGHGRPCIRLRFSWINDYPNDLIISNQGISNDNDIDKKHNKLYTRLQLPSISISFVDSLRSREVSNLTINEVNVRHIDLSKYKADTLINISWIQVDNQLPDANESVIVSPTQVKIHQPVFRLRIRKNNHLSTNNMTSYNMIEFILQELDLRLDQQLVLSSWDLYQSFQYELRASKLDEMIYSAITSNNANSLDKLGYSTGGFKNENVKKKTFELFSNPFTDLSNNITMQSDDLISSYNITSNLEGVDLEKQKTIYIESLFIGPMKLNVSFITSHSIISFNTSFDTNASISEQSSYYSNQSINDLSMLSTSQNNSTDNEGGILSSIFLFVRQVREVVLNLTSSITDAPIFFAGYSVPHLLKTEKELTRILLDHYLLSALGQLYKIVGSLDLVGNPMALVQSLGIGVKDFFYEPAHALITSPNDIGKIGRSVVKGTVSIISNTANGMIASGTTITRSMGRNIAKLTMDANYLRSREELTRPAQGMTEVFQRPVKDLSYGLSSGFVGLVKVPYNNIRRYGFINGGPTGVAKGVIGLPAKFVVGILDAVTHTGDAVREVVKVATRQKRKPLHRLRLSNLFGPDGRLLSYNMRNAFGTYILRRLLGSSHEHIDIINTNIKSVNVKKSYRSTISHHQPMVSEESDLNVDSNDEIAIDEEDLSKNKSKSYFMKYLKSNVKIQENNSSDSNETSNANSTSQEFVIYTIILPITSGQDIVAILSTKRLLVSMYIRKSGGFQIKELWQMKLNYLGTPQLEQKGGKVTLTITVNNNNFIFPIMSDHSLLEKRKTLGIGSSSNQNNEKYIDFNNNYNYNYTLTADYEFEDMLTVFYNCIITLTNNKNEPFRTFNYVELNNKEDIMSHYIMSHQLNIVTASDFEEDEYGVIHIGPWQYTLDDIQDNNNQDNLNNEEILNELENTKWIIRSRNNSELPKWLLDEQILAINAHNHLKEIQLLADDKLKHGSKLEKYLVKKLLKGSISLNEYNEIRSKNENFDNMIDDEISLNSQSDKTSRSIALLNYVSIDDDNSSKISNDTNDKLSTNENSQNLPIIHIAENLLYESNEKPLERDYTDINTNNVTIRNARELGGRPKQRISLTKKLFPEINEDDINISKNLFQSNEISNDILSVNSPYSDIASIQSFNIKNYSPFSDNFDNGGNSINHMKSDFTPGIGIDISKIKQDTINDKYQNRFDSSEYDISTNNSQSFHSNDFN